jgi:hypothetical protein
VRRFHARYGEFEATIDIATLALAPLRDVRFFQQVYIDYGAVAWPGDGGAFS